MKGSKNVVPYILVTCTVFIFGSLFVAFTIERNNTQQVTPPDSLQNESGTAVFTPGNTTPINTPGSRTQSPGGISPEVSQIISEVQQLIEDGQVENAAILAAEIYNQIDEFTGPEKIAVLGMYSNLLLAISAIQEAISVFEQLLSQEGFEGEARLVALHALGQLNMGEGNYETAVSYYNEWIASSDVKNASVLLGLANSLYNLNRKAEAITPMFEHIDLLYTQGEEVSRNKLVLLNTLAVETNDWDSAAWVTEIMIEQYNDITDWRNLNAIYLQTGDEAKRLQLQADAKSAGLMDESGNWVDTN